MYSFSKIEKKWTKKWLDSGIYESNLNAAKKPFYNLMMFPYPSAEGLHVGNMYAFTGSDIYGRFKRMNGYDVFEPIGLDGFGIHSENYAIKTGKHPKEQAKISEKNFYRQLLMIGNGFAWNERLETYNPDYYRWTQWLFIQMWKRGLAYRKKASVNWCPSCKTVLADEQVEGGKCERCGTLATKRDLEQWFFGITKYAERLLGNLDKIDWPEHIKTAQRNWIGRSEGSLIEFPIKARTSAEDHAEPRGKVQRKSASGLRSSATLTKVKVFTTRPDTIYGATYMVLAPEHELVEKLKDSIENWSEVKKYIERTKSRTDNERIADIKKKTGIELRGVLAVNPATKKGIPVWIADYVLASYGTGAIMAVPAYDERDREFAKKFKLPAPKAKLVDKEKIIKQIDGKKVINYHLRDWLISRQRYWGPPIPMIHCKKCDWQPVPEKDLPVLLPNIKNFRPEGTGEGPLASSAAFKKVKCPECGEWAERETDVSDTFLDSSWYYLRYLDVKNPKKPFTGERAGKWLPVDMYIGGAEHAVLHLLYSRFVSMVLKDAGQIKFEEPFSTLRSHGLVIKGGAKMSKSKGNVVNPDEYIKKFGADTLRMYLVFLGPYQEGGDWSDSGVLGIVRFLNRVWKLVSQMTNNRQSTANDRKLSPWMHAVIKKVTDDISELKYNTAVSELMVALNRFEKLAKSSSREEGATKKDIETFLLLLAPFAPFIAEELWEKLGNKYSIHKEKWPKYEEKFLQKDTFTLVIQINGKVRAQMDVNRGIGKDEVEKLALSNERVKSALGSKKPRKTIYVQDRLLNFVI